MNAALFRQTYQAVKGLPLLLEAVPDFTFWGCLYQINFLYLTSGYDYEDWKPTRDIVMELSTSDETLCVKIKFSQVSEFRLLTADAISGFQIEPNDDHGFGNERNFLILDYEDNRIHFYCKDIEIMSAVKTAS